MKVIDPSQLTTDLDGTLQYDHAIWIELRCVSAFGPPPLTSDSVTEIGSFVLQALEDFLWQSSDILDRLDDFREDLNHNDFADDVNGAKKSMELHVDVKRKILKIPVENIDNVGQRLLQRFFLFVFLTIVFHL